MNWVPPRADIGEMLDAGTGTVDETAASLRDLARINAWLGGYATTRRLIRPIVRTGWPAGVVVMDVGVGGGDMLVQIARWCRQARVPVTFVAVDRSALHLRLARARFDRDSPPNGVRVCWVRADATDLPCRSGAVDVVHASLVVHHFSPDCIPDLLRALFSLARRALVVNDLERHWVPVAFMSIAWPVFARSPMTRHDARASLLRAYTLGEWRVLGAAADLPRVQVRRRLPWFRIGLVCQRAH